MSKLKAVLDSNVLISGLLWKGSPNQIIKLSENKYIELFSSPQIIEEVEDVLKRKLFVSRIEAIKTTIEELIESLLSTVVIIHPKIKVNMVKEDKDDNKIIECAIQAEADAIVSGDNHLLKIKTAENIQIMTPTQFILKYQNK